MSTGSPEEKPPERVTVYIDGHNLYHGLKAKGWTGFYWLDMWQFSQNLLRPHQELVAVYYCTARVSTPEAKRIRQSTFLDANASRRSSYPFRTHIIEGYFSYNEVTCRRCNRVYRSPEEKKTDVNLASKMLVDAFRDRMDVAIIVSGDSDLVPPVREIRQHCPNVRVIVARPPLRSSRELNNSAHAAINIGAGVFVRSQMPDTVISDEGTQLHRPAPWSHPKQR